MKRAFPPSWLFEHYILNWLVDRTFRDQLPLLYKLLGLYCALYFKLYPSSRALWGGRTIFYIISNIHTWLGGAQICKIQTDKFVIFVDLLDARFLQVVNELRGEALTKTLASFLSEGDVFLDVGANQGGFSIVASHLVGNSGKVISFEPQEQLANAVRLSLAQAPAEFEVFSMALGDINGEVDFVMPLGYSGIAGLFPGFSGKDGYHLSRVKIQRADDTLNWKDIKNDLFIKLDIEGAEYKFLLGAANMIKTLHPTLLMEINPLAMKSAGTSPESMRALLESLGYNGFYDETDLVTPRALNEISFETQHNVVLVGRKHEIRH